MSQTVITTAFEALKAQQAATNTPVTLDEFVFANVPGLNITDPINPAEALPTTAQIVHRTAVAKTGVVNENAVVYSVTLGADIGDFEFNWVGLINKASNTLAMIVHAPAQQKVKNAAGVQGNVLTRSFLMEYDGAKKETQITTPAATWQIDFTARLAGMDERQRFENVDIYGSGAFINDGFLVKRSGNNYTITAGAGYVGGLRSLLTAEQVLTVATKPVKVWVDTSFTGTLTSIWQVSTAITVADTLADYVKNDVSHYVFAVAQINADGSVTDLRKIGSNTDDRLARHIAAPNDHPQYAFKKSPELTGIPTTPTAPAGTNTLQIANTQYVIAAIAALVNSSPEALDTLKELADALGNDANFAATMTNALAGKQPKDTTLTNLSGKDVAALLQYLGLSDALHKGDGRFLAGTFVSDAVDKTSIGARAATGCQFMRAHQAPDAPDQINYWQIISLTDVQAPTSAVVVLAISSSDHSAAIGFGTGDGISTWMRLPALEGAKFTGDISAPNMQADESVTVGDGSGGMAIGKRDGAGFDGNNFNISSWNGIGFVCSYDGISRVYISTRDGVVCASNKLMAGDALFNSDGNVFGSVWGVNGSPSWLSAYLMNTFPTRTDVTNALAGKPDRDSIKQVGLYQNNKASPYMLHTDNSGVFLATLTHLASTDSQIRADLQTWTNQNFVQAVRFGAVEQGNVYRAPGFADSLGYVITGIENGDKNDTPDRVQRRLFQGRVNGSWYTLGA